MQKKSKSLLAIGVILVLALICTFLYLQKNDSARTDKEQSNTCKAFDGKEYCSEDYIGLKENEAISKAQADRLTSRTVATDDGREIIINENIQPKRVNFSIEGGLVNKVEFY